MLKAFLRDPDANLAINKAAPSVILACSLFATSFILLNNPSIDIGLK